MDITLDGTVTGGTGAGVEIASRADNTVKVTLTSGADVSATSNQAIVEGAGNTTLTANAGSKITGEVHLGDGSDEVILGGADISGLTVLDGGDSSSAADGFIDTITIGTALSGIDAGKLQNWEAIKIDAVDVALSGTLTVGDGTTGTGLSLINGGTFTPSDGFTLAGVLNVGAGNTVNASAGDLTINGSVVNNGTVAFGDGVAGDMMTVNGDFGGDGVLSFDTVLNNDSSATDMLVVSGDFTGTMKVQVNNVGGKGSQTTNGIKLVDIGGDLTGSIALQGDYVTDDGKQAVIAGVYAYTLAEDTEGNLRLVSQDTSDDTVVASADPLFQPSAAVYEQYVENLFALNRLPSFRERITSMRGLGGEQSTSNSMSFASGALRANGNQVWLRMSGAHHDLDGHSSSTDSDGNIDQFIIEGGADFVLAENGTGRFFAGPTLHYGYASSDVKSHYGGGDINTNSFGVGLTGTWLANSGFYVDTQARYSWFSSDLKSDILGKQVNNNDGHGVAASMEIGQRFTSFYAMNLTPQVQLMYSDVDFDSFHGDKAERVSKDDGDRWELRAGILADRQVGDNPNEIVYGLLNAYYMLDRSSQVDVSGVTLSNSPHRFSLEAGLGGQVPVATNAQIFGEVAGRSAFDNDFSVRGSLGVKWAF